MSDIIVYTDGGCSGNPGPGGWAFVMQAGSEVIKVSGGEGETTNNRMELTAVIRALEEAAERSSAHAHPLQVFTDSMYVKNGITSWIQKWEKNGWRTAAKKPVKNRDLWMELRELEQRLTIGWNWVTGHAGVELNELCHAMVQQEISSLMRTR